VSKPPGHALHSLSLSSGKLSRPVGRSFPFGSAGPTDETLPFVLRALRRHFLASRRRETHVLFFPRKVLSGFAVSIFIAFRAKIFRPHSPSRLFLFSARAAHLARKGGCVSRSCRAQVSCRE
jgi:hypothetical protein